MIGVFNENDLHVVIGFSLSMCSRRLGDEMRNMSLEKTRQREQELVAEADRLQNEIKLLQKSSEDSANISQQLSKDVRICETLKLN